MSTNSALSMMGGDVTVGHREVFQPRTKWSTIILIELSGGKIIQDHEDL